MDTSLSAIESLRSGHYQSTEVVRMEPRSSRTVSWGPVLWGLPAMLGLLSLYLGIVSLAESWTHAMDLLREDLAWVLAIAAGFGIQVGLWSYPAAEKRHATGAGAITGASGGTSSLSMVACCLHHVADALPLIGLSGAAIFLSQYKVPLLFVGLLSNVAGVGVMWARVRQRVPKERNA